MGSSLWPPPKVSMELHVKNREKLLTSLRQHLSDSSRPLHGFVLLQVSLCLHSSSFHFSFFLTIFIQFRSRRVAKSKRVTTPITWSSSGILTLNPPHRFTFWMITVTMVAYRSIIRLLRASQAGEFLRLLVWSDRAWILWSYCSFCFSLLQCYCVFFVLILILFKCF